MEYTVQNLEYAVSVFYNGEQADRVKAHSWLTEAQRVPEAWNFVWELLQPNKNTEVQFYAATTLHTKILRCWNEVPPESYDELKQKLLHAVITYSKGPKIVTNRLCISLAAFILQQGTVDLAAVLTPLSTADNTSLLLEVLTVIPEEMTEKFTDTTLVIGFTSQYNSMTMGSALRKKNRAALQQASTMVLDDMLRYLQTVYNDYTTEPPSDEVVQSWLAAATCAGSWLTLGGEDSSEATSTTLAERTPLCRALFTAVHVLYTWNECVCGLALEACEACLGAVRAAGAAGDAARHERSAAQLLTDLAALAAPLLAAHNVPNSMNEELLSAVITCCVAVCEWHARVLVAGVQREPAGAARRLLELLLAAQAAPGHYPLHETRSNLVFGLWYTLQDEVLHMTRGGEKVHPVWNEVFSELLRTLITKSEAPVEQALSRDDEELLRCYRQDIGDTVLYCYSIVGETCWHIVDEALRSATRDERREAALHVFQALADISPTDSTPECLLRTLEQAIHIANTSHNKRMLSTALDCLGSYASWLGSVSGAERARAVSLAGASVRAAGSALPRAPAAAALALRKLCDDCAEPAAESALDIVRAAQSPEGRSDAWVRRQLISAAGAALAAAAPPLAEPTLLDLARTLHDELSAQVELVAQSGKDKASARCAAVEAERAAKCVAALLTSLSVQPALAARLLRALLPALAHMPHHAALTTSMFLILKQGLMALMTDCVPMVPEIAQLTATGLNTLLCPVGLEVTQLLVLYVADSWAGAGQLLHGCVVGAARRVAADCSAHPDLVDALFSLLLAVTKKKTAQLALDAIEDLLPELIELARACIKLPEASASNAACTWLAALACKRPDAMQPHGQALVDTILRCIGGVTPRTQLEPLAALLLALNRAAWSGAGLAEWLRPALAPPAFPSPLATPAHRAAFITAVLREKVSKRRTLEAVHEFSLACRGLIGTEYARQTIASKQLVA